MQRQIERSEDGVVWGIWTVIDGGRKTKAAKEDSWIESWVIVKDSNLVILTTVA